MSTYSQPEIQQYNLLQSETDRQICEQLMTIINETLTEATSKLWHGHPVWFLNENPVVGYSKQKKGIRLMFWSGADFGEDMLSVRGGKFRDASVFFQHPSQIKADDLKRCLHKCREIQWDYKNIVKRKGKLERL